MINYTKGKWTITECAMQTYGEPIQHLLITSDSGEFSGRTLADIGLWRDFPEDMVRANTRLIAKSPKMYEAIQSAIVEIEDGSSNHAHLILTEAIRGLES